MDGIAGIFGFGIFFLVWKRASERAWGQRSPSLSMGSLLVLEIIFVFVFPD